MPPITFALSQCLGVGQSQLLLRLQMPPRKLHSCLLPRLERMVEWSSTFVQFVSNGDLFLGIAKAAIYTKQGKFSSSTFADNGTINSALLQIKVPRDGTHRHFARWIGVDGDTSTSSSSLLVELSRDDGQTFETARTIDMTSTKKKIYRCGSHTGDLLVRLSHADDADLRLGRLLARID
jgi:hypothetical protein